MIQHPVQQSKPSGGNLGEPGPVLHPENGVWRPESKRVGIGPYRYVWWNAFYAMMEFLNRKLARDPNRKVSWDYWHPALGLLYLLSKIRFNRSNALTDPYDYKSLDNAPPGVRQPDAALKGITANGEWVSDESEGRMGAAMTRFSSNRAPRKARPDTENIKPSAREVAKQLRWRHLNDAGEEITTPALILNVLAQAWIQFQFHGFGGNTLRDPINQNPYRVPRDPEDGWPNNEALIDRTTQDPTRPSYDGRPTPINEKVHAWVQGQLYGNNEAELKRLRTDNGRGAKLLLDSEGLLPEDPDRPGVDLAGFNNNYNPYLSFLHWLFVKDHNAIVDYFKAFHPDWDEETLFQMARKTNCAQITRIHTVEWTEDLLQHPTLQLGMHADWYGFLGQKLKCRLMRAIDRHPWLGHLLKPISDDDVIWGMPGSAWDHHDGPFQVPRQFRLVYRLHEMLLGENEVTEPETGRHIETVGLIDFIHHHTRRHVKRFGYDLLGWSFVSKSCGALTLHNFPRALTRFERMQDGNLIDLSELDIFREREDATGSYNDLRMSMGEPPVTSFMELTGGNATLARELEIAYHGEVDRVDAGIGILAEPRPAGFALGFIQFYQFVLNAPRRIKSNRFLAEGYTYREYQEGLNWVEHGGGFKGLVRRHLPRLAERLEGVQRGFAPWPDTETFPERLLWETKNDNGKALRADLRTLLLGALAATLGIVQGMMPLGPVVAIILLLLGVSIAVASIRLFARRFMQVCEKKCNTDRRQWMFGPLYRTERSVRIASHVGRTWCLAVILLSAGSAYMAMVTHPPAYPWIFALFILTAISAFSTKNWSNAFIWNIHVLKVALRNRMRAGHSVTQGRALTPEEDRTLERLFRTYAPGRQYLTAYDFERMYETERSRDPVTGYGKRWSRHILLHYADLIVEEDRELVPAISRDTYVRLIQGVAQQDLQRERKQFSDPATG